MNEESLMERRSSWGFSYRIKIPKNQGNKDEQLKKQLKLTMNKDESNIEKIAAKLDESLRESKINSGKKETHHFGVGTNEIFQSFFDKHKTEEAHNTDCDAPNATLTHENFPPRLLPAVDEDLRTVSLSETIKFTETERKSHIFFAEETTTSTEKEFQKKLAAVRDMAFHPPLGPSPAAPLSDPQAYIYRRHVLNRDLLELVSQPPSFENFVRLFNHFCALETANFKSQTFYDSPWVTWLFERLIVFLRDDFELRVVEAERCDQIVQVKPNMKNVFNQERLEVVLNLQHVFERASNALERFEMTLGRDAVHLSTERGCTNVKFKIFKAFSHARKMSKYLSHHPELSSQIEEARKAALQPQLHSFNEASARFEENNSLFQELTSKIERCGQNNMANSELAYAKVAQQLQDIFDCPAIDACRLFLA